MSLGIFLNSEELSVVEEHLERYALEGVTTNVSMLAKLGNVNFANYLHDMRKILGEKVFLTQVTSTDPAVMLEEAELIRRHAGERTFVKFPCTPEGLYALKIFSGRGGHSAGTLCFSVVQGVLALLAGADYIAPFYQSMNDVGTDGLIVLRQLAGFIRRSGCKGRILSASCRNSADLGTVFEVGCDAATVNPKFFEELNAPGMDRFYGKFLSDWAAAHPDGATLLDLHQ
ncbi:MAG: transaldolase family protein [Victivallaceae bacterium]|nr:transaldolase family protein [Victivallaceae bacterium]